LRWHWQQIRFLFGARQVIELRPGWRLVCHPLAYPHSYRAQRDDPEQAAEFDGFIDACRPGMILFDVGAHFGLFSLAALHYGGPTARAVAIDASTTAVGLTQIQARLNGVADRLTVVCACACQDEGVRDMVAVGVLANGYFTAPGRDHSGRELTATPAITLDGLAERTGLWPTHLKIDVEGYEGQVLRGAKRLLTHEEAPTLFIELHNVLLRQLGEEPAAVLAQLEEIGYRFCGPTGRPVSTEVLLGHSLVRFVAKREPA
jgi:FkbM family methyltransferase